MIAKTLYRRALAMLLLLAMSVPLMAEAPVEAAAPAVSIKGRILDPMRAPIAGAQIIAVRSGAAALPPVTSGPEGEFVLAVPAGIHTLKVVAGGFEEVVRSIDASQGEPAPLEITLAIAARHEMVTVTESAGYQAVIVSSATKTLTPLQNVPQSVTVITQELMKDQMMMSIADVVRYVPGITAHQGENNRDQLVIRGNNSTADFFVNGVRDDVQYLRDLYNLDRVEALKGPNAMIFGRGGGGGVINRVTKEAGFAPLREVSLLGGSYNNKRFTTDFNQPLSDKAAFRLNALYENSDSFRRYAGLERYGISPSVTIAPRENTSIRLNYEHLGDRRVADRGVPALRNRPAGVDIRAYFGNPDESRVRLRADLGSASLEHQIGRLNIRNHTLVGDYDRFYQNFLPGPASAAGTHVALSAYNNSTQRRNVFNQTDMVYSLRTGSIRHTLLTGVEVGRQRTDNFRNTGYFNNSATSFSVPLANGVISTPVTFRQSASDANNDIRTSVAATYLQDQIDLTRRVQVVAGVRFDHFDLRYHNNRNGEDLRRIDNMISPRLGVVVKPLVPLSVYASYSVSHLPSAGDQFSSLTTVTQQVKPEKFNNYEVGLKWDVANSLSVTTALYRLDRTNTRSTDPNNPTRIVQTGSQRSNGYELALNGNVTRAWSVAAAYSYQDAFISSATTAARAGAQVALVPHHTFAVWNNYRILPRWGAGLGLVHRTDMFAGFDNTTVLPGYVRGDAALYFSATEKIRIQANVENLFNTNYYPTADGNNNIAPGSPRAVRVGMIVRF